MPRRFVLLIGALTVVMAHVVLPALGRETLMPFNTWRLFEGVTPRNVFYDVELEYSGAITRLASRDRMIDPELRMFLIARTWMAVSKPDEHLETLLARVQADGAKIKSIRRIRIPLGEYMLLDEQGALGATEIVRSFQ